MAYSGILQADLKVTQRDLDPATIFAALEVVVILILQKIIKI